MDVYDRCLSHSRAIDIFTNARVTTRFLLTILRRSSLAKDTVSPFNHFLLDNHGY